MSPLQSVVENVLRHIEFASIAFESASADCDERHPHLAARYSSTIARDEQQPKARHAAGDYHGHLERAWSPAPPPPAAPRRRPGATSCSRSRRRRRP